jgi:hypothetical protein
MLRRALLTAALSLLGPVACSPSAEPVTSANAPAISSEPEPSSPAASVPADTAADAPSANPPAGNSSAEPDAKKKGRVPPGGKCTREVWQPEAAAFEGGTDCLALPAFATPDRPTGSVCVMESGPGAYCTHACRTDADCKDLVREGFRGACSATLCLLQR